MTLEGWFTLGVVVLLVAVLALTRIGADLVLMAALTLFMLFNILTPAEALVGFANPGVITVGALFVVAAGLRDTGGIFRITQRLLGRPGSTAEAQLRLMSPVVVMSAFLNNTPVVGMFIPAVTDWAKRFDLSVSKLLLPLSYAAILGGTVTLIGTSTNLLVNGLLLEADRPGLGMFELAWVGVPTALVGVVFIILVSRWLLPERRPAVSLQHDPREYTAEMVVDENGPLVGKSVEQAGLRNLPSTFLAEIERSGRIIPAIAPQEVLQANDRLVFVGIVDSVVELQKFRGLLPAPEQVFKLNKPRPERTLVEAVVSNTCPLLGKSIREGNFRTTYNAVVIAVARNGERIHKKIGDIVLKPGDTLLLETRPNFALQQRDSKDFFLVSMVQDSSPPDHDRAFLAIAILAGMVLSVAVGLLDMLTASLAAAGLMVATRCCTGAVARRSIDWQVLIVIGAAFGIGQALEVTGAAQATADGLLQIAGNNPWVNLLVIYIVTAVFTALITNNAAAVLVFPVALTLAQDLQVDFRPFAIAVALAASASFATPMGYQTNLMVFGPGGYHFSDYLRIGVPLTLLTALIAVLIIPLVWHF